MTDRNRILVLFAHPAIDTSRVNRRLVAAIDDLEDVTVCDLYAECPEFDIDVAEQQRLLEAHDTIVFQHPFYWYSTPAILKEWQDLVLEHGWAYGEHGTALRGKRFMAAVTAGGGEAAYRPDGANRFTIRQLLVPVEQTARLCGMEFLPPFVVYGTHSLTEQDIVRHAADYRRLVTALRDRTIDLDAARRLAIVNSDLDAVLER